jgi:hypothetical protein
LFCGAQLLRGICERTPWFIHDPPGRPTLVAPTRKQRRAAPRRSRGRSRAPTPRLSRRHASGLSASSASPRRPSWSTRAASSSSISTARPPRAKVWIDELIVGSRLTGRAGVGYRAREMGLVFGEAQLKAVTLHIKEMCDAGSVSEEQIDQVLREWMTA